MGTTHWESTVVKENNSKLIRGDVHSDNDSNDGGETTAARRRWQGDSGKTATVMKKKEASS